MIMTLYFAVKSVRIGYKKILARIAIGMGDMLPSPKSKNRANAPGHAAFTKVS